MNLRQLSTKHGSSLLEVLLAMMLFAIVGTALIESLSVASEATALIATEHMVRERLRSEMDRSRALRLTLGKEDMGTDAYGITVQRHVERMELENNERVTLNGIYKATFTARWKDGVHENELTAETWIFQP